jgi:hypothetical protein
MNDSNSFIPNESTYYLITFTYLLFIISTDYKPILAQVY